MCMNKLVKYLFVATALFAGPSMAELITPTLNPNPTECVYGGADPTCWADNNGNPDQPSLDELAYLVGITMTSDLAVLYKDETNGKNPGQEEGSFAGSYTTTWNPADNEEEASGAYIGWDGGSFIVCPECYLWVKDGQSNPNLYVFDLSDWWNGRTTLTLAGFWLEPVYDPETDKYVNGAISNLGIFGRVTQVPEPGMLGLLGIAALGLGLVWRRRVNG